MNALQASLARSPEQFPFSLDPRSDQIFFLHLTQDDYEAASFLDARILTPQTQLRPLPWLQVAAALESANLAERCSFIFHIGHVGSTLISRLIGAHPGVLALREPTVLRTFAQVNSDPEAGLNWSDGDFNARLTGALKLFSRTFDRRQLPIIKATSFVSEISATLMARAAAPKALMMFVSPESYLATILGGPNSRKEALILAPARLRRLHRRIGTEAWTGESLSEGENLALAWACEMSALAQAASTAGKRAFWLNFDHFLADPSTLLSIFHHFDIDAHHAEVNAIVGGRHMRRYSKAPEHAYDAALRVEVLNEARALHGAEIRRGLNWLERAAAKFEPIRQAVTIAAATISLSK
ncbi:MAG: hypothetical protein QOK23_2550 [Gammaproteobacteria bacterium]|jgi:hypothetical protein|nr:hypothetical protein [Gammaproteobacteria bacterium]